MKNSNLLRASVMSVLTITLVFGLLFPAVVTALGGILFKKQAEGSLLRAGSTVIGSELIGQSFSAPGYLHPRPSAAGSGYDASLSGGTNLGPTSDKLINGIHKKLPDGKDDPGNFDGIKDLAAAYRTENGLAKDAVLPADAATRSASGLDPEISPENAALQAARIARIRGLTETEVKRIIETNTAGRQLGVLGEARVNVLKANLALDAAAPGKTGAK